MEPGLPSNTPKVPTKSPHQPATRERLRSAASVTRALLRPRNVVVAVVILIIAYLVIVPLGYVVKEAFFRDGQLSLANFIRVYRSERTLDTITNTVIYSAGSTVLAAFLGSITAYLVVRTDAPFKRLTLLSALIPAFLPSILYAPGWIFLADPNAGILTSALKTFMGTGWLDIFSMPGLIWIQGLHLAPLAFLMMYAAFRAMDPSLEESAAVCGASALRVFFKITLPLARPALISSLLIIALLALESFDVPVMIGVPAEIYVFTTQIYVLLSQMPFDLGAAGTLGVSLIILALILLLLSQLWKQRGASYETISGKGYRPSVVPLRRTRKYIGAALVAYAIITFVAPLGSIVYVSFLRLFEPLARITAQSFTLNNYSKLVSDAGFLDALQNTVIVAVVSATAVMILSVVAGWFVVRTRAPLRKLVDGLAFTPIVLPGLVLGLALLVLYLRIPFPVYQTVFILMISLTTRFLPYGMRYVVNAMSQVGNDLEESAYVFGARWGTTLRKILLPLVLPGVLAGWLYVLSLSFREFSTAILLVGPDSNVLSVFIFQQFEEGRLALLAATGVIMILVLSALGAVGYKVGVRFGMR